MALEFFFVLLALMSVSVADADVVDVIAVDSCLIMLHPVSIYQASEKDITFFYQCFL